MDYSSIPLFNVMKTKLNYLSERQSVLAQNIANADTPGYKAKDLSSPDFKKLITASGSAASSLKMTPTEGGRFLTGTPSSSGEFRQMKRATTEELNPNGNNVSIEEETAKVGVNQAEYQKVLNLYTKTVSMFKTAIGNPNAG